MKATFWSICLIGSLALTTVASAEKKGLYADTDAATTSGNLNEQDYWWAKFDAMMLEEAIKTRQPEGTIAVDLASSIRRLDTLAKAHPKHAEIQKWKARADEVAAKIDPAAPRGGPYKPGFLWGEANYAQAWVNWHWARMVLDAKDVKQAEGLYANVVQNLTLLTRPERMKDYPEATRKWVLETRPKAEKLLAGLRAKRG